MKDKNIGLKYGRLTIVSFDKIPLNDRHRYYICQCDCGNMKSVSIARLRKGTTQSCGCLQREAVSLKNRKHGESKTKLYHIWQEILIRTETKTSIPYKDYGGRGIKVCDEWKKDYLIFKDWAISNGYREGLSIDRIDNNGGYSPLNCRWVTHKEQNNNKRNNRLITYNNNTMTIAQWADTVGLRYGLLYQRLTNNWEVGRALGYSNG